MAAYGADASTLPDRLKKSADYEVWAEHQDAVAMFLCASTQWRTSPSGVMGLDYSVLLGPGGLLDLYDISDKRQTLEDVQIIELRARELINEASQKEVKKAQQTGMRRRARS